MLSTLRRYPYPLIAYKIAINKFLTSTTPQPSAETPITTLETQTTQYNPPQTTIINEKTIIENTPTPADSINEEHELPAKHQSPLNNKAEPPINSSDLDFKTLWNKVIGQLSKPTVQSNLKDQAIIEKKEGNLIFVTVITPIADMLIKNEENKKQIELFLSQELGESVFIQSNYEKKEDYFARKMGL